MLLKRLCKISFLIAILVLFNSDSTIYNKEYEKIDNILENKEVYQKENKYFGYINIPKYGYTKLIKNEESLDTKNISLVNNKGNIESSSYNIVLAGHNTKNVFSVLYRLDINDEIIINTFNFKYKFKVYNIEMVNIKDTYVLDNEYDKKILTLITCTQDNQKRLIIKAKNISHNFT